MSFVAFKCCQVLSQEVCKVINYRLRKPNVIGQLEPKLTECLLLVSTLLCEVLSCPLKEKRFKKRKTLYN